MMGIKVKQKEADRETDGEKLWLSNSRTQNLLKLGKDFDGFCVAF